MKRLDFQAGRSNDLLNFPRTLMEIATTSWNCCQPNDALLMFFVMFLGQIITFYVFLVNFVGRNHNGCVITQVIPNHQFIIISLFIN